MNIEEAREQLRRDPNCPRDASEGELQHWAELLVAAESEDQKITAWALRWGPSAVKLLS